MLLIKWICITYIFSRLNMTDDVCVYNLVVCILCVCVGVDAYVCACVCVYVCVCVSAC
jgi:hypothetical protein